MPRLHQIAVPFIVGAASLAIGVPALAQDSAIVITGDAHHNREIVRQSVNIADLNMATAVGQHQAHLRVDKAINRVCPHAAGNVLHHERESTSECRRIATASAYAQMRHAIMVAKGHHHG